jgi:hypothetical protein
MRRQFYIYILILLRTCKFGFLHTHNIRVTDSACNCDLNKKLFPRKNLPCNCSEYSRNAGCQSKHIFVYTSAFCAHHVFQSTHPRASYARICALKAGSKAAVACSSSGRGMPLREPLSLALSVSSARAFSEDKICEIMPRRQSQWACYIFGFLLLRGPGSFSRDRFTSNIWNERGGVLKLRRTFFAKKSKLRP